jgi:hypothetical protein
MFIELLDAHNIKYKQIKHTDPDFQNYPDLVKEAESCSIQALSSKKWIIMRSRDFKKMVMCLRTSRADAIREYYLALEDLFKMYCEYTLHFQLKCAGNSIGALTEQMRLMRLDREKDRQQHEKDRQRFEEDRQERRRQHQELKDQNHELIERNKETQDTIEVMNDNLHEVRRDAVPKSKRDKKMPKVGLMRKSSNYSPARNDPGYFRTSDLTVIRRQTGTFNQRVNEIRSYGAGTNSDAALIWERDNPNAINFYNRLTELPGTPFEFEYVGIKYREGGSEALILEEMDKTFDEKMNLPPPKREPGLGDIEQY